jgi:hypothetical protein
MMATIKKPWRKKVQAKGYQIAQHSYELIIFTQIGRDGLAAYLEDCSHCGDSECLCNCIDGVD